MQCTWSYVINMLLLVSMETVYGYYIIPILRFSLHQSFPGILVKNVSPVDEQSYIVYAVLYLLYNVRCKVYTVRRIFYNAHCKCQRSYEVK